jgi:hypothetical protein
LNAVLSGYFVNVVGILINRRQKLLIPYVFAEDSEVLDNLLYHVYQKSISDLLKKFMAISASDFDGSVAENIKTKQKNVLRVLIQKLGPEASEEDNLNGSLIIQDLSELKEFYSIISTRDNIQTLINMAFATSGSANQKSQTAALGVLNQLI